MRIVQGPSGYSPSPSVNKLWKEELTEWVDVSDFATPGAVVVLSGGTASFESTADLSIDVGVVGHHEFDWGIGCLRPLSH